MSDRAVAVTQDTYYAQIPTSIIYHPDLSGNDIRIYAALADRAGKKGYAWPSIRRLADDLGMSPSTVQKCLKTLERTKVIKVDRTSQEVNLYHLPAHPPAPVYQSTLIAVPDFDQGVPKTGTELNPRTKPKELKPPPTPPTARPSPAPMLPEEEVARLWCSVTGQTPTRSVLRSMIPTVREYLALAARPSEEDLQRWHADGIRTPAGWGFVAERPPDDIPDWLRATWDERAAAEMERVRLHEAALARRNGSN